MPACTPVRDSIRYVQPMQFGVRKPRQTPVQVVDAADVTRAAAFKSCGLSAVTFRAPVERLWAVVNA